MEKYTNLNLFDLEGEEYPEKNKLNEEIKSILQPECSIIEKSKNKTYENEPYDESCFLEKDKYLNELWKITETVRGICDGYDLRNYIYTILFYKCLSEKTKKNNNLNLNFPEEYYYDIFLNKLETNEITNVSDELKAIFNYLEDNNELLKNIFNNINFGDNKLGATVEDTNENLKKLMINIGKLKLKQDITEQGYDVFGDAYEYLSNLYAINSGKSGGEFYTPPEVSVLLSKLATLDRENIETVYDPTCGAGSLLMKAISIISGGKIKKVYGQEINNIAFNLCRMNIILHNLLPQQFSIELGDTLKKSSFQFSEEKVDIVVSNPPYSVKWEGNDNPLLINDPRYSPAGVLAPKSNADWAFILHSLYCLNPNGVGAIVIFPGILYRTGAEKKIRQYMVDNNYIDCIINLPENLFYGTSIATCILVIKKNKKNNNVLFIDGTKECIKITNNNKLSNENIETLLNWYKDRKDNKDVKLVSYEEIVKNDYDLKVNTYVDNFETEEVVDIKELKNELNELINVQIKENRDLLLNLDQTDAYKSLLELKKACRPETLSSWEQKN